jgi:hypothetical protein
MKYIKSFNESNNVPSWSKITYNESIDELQQWINAVLENCKDIMLDMQNLFQVIKG